MKRITKFSALHSLPPTRVGVAGPLERSHYANKVNFDPRRQQLALEANEHYGCCCCLFLHYFTDICMEVGILRGFHRRTRAASHAMYDLDSAEIVSLLSRSPDPVFNEDLSSVQTELIPSETNSIICAKCNFANPASATVCRECNSLLRGNEVFSSSFRKMYWRCLLQINW